MKTICLDLRALQVGHQNRGIGMHIRSILENLPESDDRYLFYCFDESSPIEKLGIKTKVNYKIIQSPTINTSITSFDSLLNIPKLIFHRFGPLRSLKPDVFVQFDFMLGLPRWRGVRKVMIGYDLIPLIMRNDYLPGVRHAWNHTAGKKQKIKAVVRSLYYQFRRWLHYRAYNRADKVICISEYSAKSFHDLLGIPKSKIVSIPLAPVASDSEIDGSLAKSINKPYVLYIGGTDSRKKVEEVVYAFNIARGRGENLALVLAGNEFSKLPLLPSVTTRSAIEQSPYKDDIHLVGFISNSQKMGLYKNAVAFIFCSNHEGFGLPVVESMSAGCPVIAYDNSSIPEASGGAAILIDTGDYLGVAQAICQLHQHRQRYITLGLKNTKRFSWGEYVKKFIESIY